jgi:hypothetical protein
MRRVMRWLLRNVVLIWLEEWANAQQEMRERQVIHRIQIYCDTELRIFRIGLTDLARLQAEAAQAITRFPAARDFIEEMLQKRIQHLVHTLNEEASRGRRAA